MSLRSRFLVRRSYTLGHSLFLIGSIYNYTTEGKPLVLRISLNTSNHFM